MNLYINGIGCISSQKSFEEIMFPLNAGGRLQCAEPDYSTIHDPRAIRRMSRILKFGVGAAKLALSDAGNPELDAISTGTGLGCLDDSGIFLRNVVESGESAVSPTPFIQSTHNTVSGQIALALQCQKPNNTFSQKGFSFESALSDIILLANEEAESKTFLLGASDEITGYSFTIQQRLNAFRKTTYESLQTFLDNEKGVTAGEGSTFFVLGKEKQEKTYAKITALNTFFQPENRVFIEERIARILQKNGLKLDDVDFVLSGVCGDKKRDELLHELNDKFFMKQSVAYFKPFSGEYMTASSFALWLSAKMVQTQTVPPEIIIRDCARLPKNVLICNAYKNYYSLILVQQA